MRKKEKMSEQEQGEKRRKRTARIKEKENQPYVKGKVRLSIQRK